MQFISKNDSLERKNSDVCSATEYEFTNNSDINCAVIRLSGRYPENGFAVNSVCKELIYVIEGEGTLVTDQASVTLGQDDMITIHVGDKYSLQGNLKLLISSSPAWYPEQYSTVD